MMQWISVKDRLPIVEINPEFLDVDGLDNGKRFLVCDADGYRTIDTFWAKSNCFENDDAIYWMPLPEPPKE